MGSSAFTGYVYLITNLVNGKKYVGCTTTSLKHRWAQHLSQARSKSKFALHRAINKYGHHNFSVEILETIESSLVDLFSAEVHQISSNKSLAPVGYNLTVGGDGIGLLAPEAQERRREVYTIAMKLMHADPSWLESVSNGSRERSKRPDWRQATVEAGHRRALDPEWQKANTEKNNLLRSDPQYLNIVRNLPKDPEWRKAQLAGVRRRSNNPEWIERNSKALAATRAARLDRIRAAEEVLTPEERLTKEQSRIEKSRDYARLYQANKRAERRSAEIRNETIVHGI